MNKFTTLLAVISLLICTTLFAETTTLRCPEYNAAVLNSVNFAPNPPGNWSKGVKPFPSTGSWQTIQVTRFAEPVNQVSIQCNIDNSYIEGSLTVEAKARCTYNDTVLSPKKMDDPQPWIAVDLNTVIMCN